MQFHAFVLLLLLYLTTAARVQFCHTNPSKSIDLCLALASVRSQSTTTTITSIDADGTIGSGSSKSSSNQDVYMHISSRFVGRRGWAAFGTGTIMHGSLMIVVYPGENEGDVTVSLRTTHGHLPPEPSDDLPSYQVLQTNVEGEYYHVYIACYACDSKIAAKGRPVINVGTTQQPWIWAVHPLQVMQTADTNHPLRYHGDKYGSFTLNMANGRMQSSPMTNLSILSIDREPTGLSEPHESGAMQDFHQFLFQLHGFLLAVVFTLIMPLGVGIIRKKEGKSAFSRHWILQLVAVVVALVGMSIAIVQSKNLIQFGNVHGTHKLFGLCILALILVQPCIGYRHHLAYIKLGRRTAVTYVHMHLGRAILMLGWTNIALGLYIAGASVWTWVVWMACLFVVIVIVLLRPEVASRLLKGKEETVNPEYELVDGDETCSQTHNRD